jgi:peptide/nickel transport system substrate-binding protein
MGKASIGLRAAVLASVTAMTLAACGGGGDGDGGPGTDGGDGGGAQKGGTLTFLTLQDQFTHLDPQRNYTGEDLAFAGGYLHRTLTAYAYSKDSSEAGELVGDLATDTGTPNEDATSWSWTLKDGLKWEDGSDLTCEDVKYGVSRTFATDTITDGPQYAVSMLDIPTDKDGASVYKGPYVTKNNDTAAFDKAVVCDGNTITFNLNKPVGDFNYTVTLLSFSPVPKAADTGEKYDDKPVSNGPYKITEYSKGSQLVLDRNENWDPATDEYRPAYPDKIVVKFGLEASVIDQRMIQDSGADQQTLTPDPIEPASLATVFGDDRFADRRTNELDPYVRYIVVNVDRVPNLEHRKAIAAAMDRAQLRTIAGGEYAGDLADGVIKPNLPTDYAPTGWETDLFGEAIPPEGNPDLAMRLIAESGEPMPDLTWDYPQTPTRDQEAAIIIDSYALAGINVTANPITTRYYSTIFSDAAHEFGWAGWGPDWPNASTIIPPLFTDKGGWNLSRVGSVAADEDFVGQVATALGTLDRTEQAGEWQDLNKEAMLRAYVIPTTFGRTQVLKGTNIFPLYQWAPYGSWAYAEVYVTP